MCHWESSRRSLYVKTVWTNGHHHAILSPEDPLLVKPVPRPSSYKDRKSFSVIPRHRSAKEVLVSSSPNEYSDLSVSSVQIFADGFRSERPRSKRQSSMYRIRETEKAICNAAPTIAVIPLDSLKTQNLNEEVQFGRKQKRKSCRSNSYDIAMPPSSRDPEKMWMEPYVSGLNHSGAGQNCGAVLTERVMLWLDLARQSQEGCIKTFERDRVREDVDRKQSRRSLTGFANWVPYLDYDKGEGLMQKYDGANGNADADADAACKNNRDDLHLNDLSILKSSPMRHTQRPAISETVTEAHRRRKAEDVANNNNNIGEGRKKDRAAAVVSSKLENAHCLDVSVENERSYDGVLSKYSGNAVNKRQLHIFMPNVPKKKVDGEGRSILSDISSRYSTKVKFTV